MNVCKYVSRHVLYIRHSSTLCGISMLNVHIVVETPSVHNHRVVLHNAFASFLLQELVLTLVPTAASQDGLWKSVCQMEFKSHASHRRQSDVHLSYVSGANSRRVRTAQVSFCKREWVLTIL